MNILILTLFLHGAFLPDYNLYYGINEEKYEILELDNAYQIELGVDLYFFNIFFIRGSINNLFHKEKNALGFYPDHDEYRVSIGLRYKFIEIGYEHLCFHPIFTYSTNNISYNGKPLINNTLLEGSYDKLYFNFELQSEF